MSTGSKRLLIGFNLTFLVLGYLSTRFTVSGSTTMISIVFIIIQASPSTLSLFRWQGKKRAGILLLTLSLLTLIVEAFAIVTGFPYGGFYYSDELGYRLFNLVPWPVTLAYLPILLGSYGLASRIFGDDRWRTTLISALLVLAADLVIDPGAVNQGLWIWTKEGGYYGIPLVNFLGWGLTGFVYSNILYWAFHRERKMDSPPPVGLSTSLTMILHFWTGVSLGSGLTIPLLLGSVFILYLNYWMATGIVVR